MDSQNIISVREFARRVGVSEGNIRKVIKSQKISEGLNSAGKIIFDVALSEYRQYYSHKMPEEIIYTEKPKKQKPVNKKKVVVKKVKAVPVIVEPKEPEIKIIKFEQPVDEPDTEEPETDVIPEDKPIRLKNSTQFNESKRVEALVKARKEIIELEQLKGSLVSSKQVYKELFAVGQTVRSAMQGIPDKFIDNLLACETRSEAHEMLTKAITQALEELSNATKEVEI